jgi:hypothetical protein
MLDAVLRTADVCCAKGSSYFPPFACLMVRDVTFFVLDLCSLLVRARRPHNENPTFL